MIRPRPLNHRADLIRLVREHVPTRACRRAIDEGRTTVLGGCTPAQGFPYWLVEIESVRNRTWYIAVVANESAYKYEVKYVDRVNWAEWSGDSARRHPVYDGDDPERFECNMLKAQRETCREPTA